MTKNTEIDKLLNNNNVGPIMRAGDVADAVVEAAIIDNPGKNIVVDNKNAYIRISANNELRLTRETIELELGRPFKMNEIEIELASFAGRIKMTTDEVIFYYITNMQS
ncbi:MmoB/DmpM family protein [Zhongshania sp. BJYM1]|uniref:MmoB/DmpM family protein n=1 Tax=Zhongshania aquatica TaxID=2965069 RepID=UPI0022B4AC8D|nr:MmoB/DmpM family protein [Marortus sp. BJYM1]